VHDRGDFFFHSLFAGSIIINSNKNIRIVLGTAIEGKKKILTQRHLPAIHRASSSDRGIFLEGPFGVIVGFDCVCHVQ
jgi:hypothetical protein